MSDTLVAIFFGAGVGAWVYARLARHNGGANASNTLMAAGFVGIIAAIVIFTAFKFILHV